MPPLGCRETEYSFIADFTQLRVTGSTPNVLFIAGVCGSGKTATLRQLQGDLPSYKWAHLTLKGLSSTSLISTLCEQVSQTKPGLDFLRKVSTSLASRTPSSKENAQIQNSIKGCRSRSTQPTVVVLDEADSFELVGVPLMTALVEASVSVANGIALILVSNSKSLTFTSTTFLTELTFSAYTHSDLEKIVVSHSKSRGENIESKMSKKAIAFAVKSVWNADARKAIEICSTVAGGKRAREDEVLGIANVTAVVQRSNTLQELDLATPMVRQILLCGVQLEKAGKGIFSPNDISTQHMKHLVVDAPRPSRSEIESSLSALSDMHLISQIGPRAFRVSWPLAELEENLLT